MSDFSIYKLIKMKAVLEAVENTEGYFYRSICREMSKKFGMPLDVVEKKPVVWLLQHYYEDGLEEIDMDQFPEIMDKLITPEGSSEHQKQMDDFDQAAIDENIKELEKKGYKIVDGKKVKIGQEAVENKKDGVFERIKEEPEGLVIKDFSDMEEED
jgi:hypothetical protein